jgi:hypothetical protein
MFIDLGLCPSEIQFLDSGNGLVLVLTDQQIYLQAWDGSAWSAPQLQEALTSFLDPDTQRQVSLDCRQALLSGSEAMYLIGCGSGPAEDIWLMQRPLLDLENWFAGEPVWSPPFSITNTPNEIIDPAMVVDGEERVHAFWSQHNDPISGAPGISIFYSFYSRLEGGQWSRPEAILSSPEGKALQPAAAVDAQGRIMVVWSGGKTGEIFFSQTNPATASAASSWSEPVILPSPSPGARSPDIAVDPGGNIYVVYVISLNEGRGVYLTSSSDNGTNWRPPLEIFDAAAAHWAMVDTPRLAITSTNHLHLLWTRYSLPPEAFPEALYYSRSEDGGTSWSPAAVVVDKPALWSELVGVGESTINRIWQEQGSAGTTIWHEVSRDAGISWERTAPVSIFGEIIKSPSVSVDRATRLHLMQIVNRGVGTYALQHWVYDGERWGNDQSLEMNLPDASDISSPVASISPNGVLNVLFSSVTGNVESGSLQNNLLVTSRTLEVPEVVPVATQVSTPTPEAKPSPEPTRTIGLTSVPVVIPTKATPSSNPTLSPNPEGVASLFQGTILGPLIGGVLVVILISGYFFIRGARRR